MDYPKSVPGVGLVGGKFVDENTATGQQGSLIPSVWGNAVTEEISNVIKDAGDIPAEGELSQLQKAIRKIVALVWPKASDAEVAAGAVDDKVVTPKKLLFGFTVLLAPTGFVMFPKFLRSVVLQWGTASTSGGLLTKSVVFPMTYPNVAYVVVATHGGYSSGQRDYPSTGSLNVGGFTLYSSVTDLGHHWISVGY